MLDVVFQFLTIVGSLGLFKFAEFLITRKDKKQERIEDKEEKLKKLEEKMQATVEQRSSEVKKQFEFQASEIRAQSAKEQAHYSEIKEVLVKNAEDDKERDMYMRTMGEALMGIIHDRVIRSADIYIERDGVTREELSTLTSMYRPYKALGGNGDVETAFNLVGDLDLITKEEACKRDAHTYKRKIKAVTEG